MKKIILTITCILFACTLSAQQKLPFIGKRYFNFVGGTGGVESVTIEKNGMVTIASATGNEQGGIPVIEYKGQYLNLMKTDFGYYSIRGNKISSVDKNGKTKKGCNGNDNAPCVTELYKPE